MDPRESGAAAYKRSITEPTPLDPLVAASRMRQVKTIFDRLGVVFWLGSGTCLGAVRDGDFIPWDDETDTASVIGLHGLTEDRFDEVVSEFEAAGFYAHVGKNSRYNIMSIVKDGLRTDWTVHHIVDGAAWEFPGIRLSLGLFKDLQTVQFAGEQFQIPGLPEEYLSLKYGPNWSTPRGPGFEEDVVDNIPDGSVLSYRRKVSRMLVKWLNLNIAIGIRVFDANRSPISEAVVRIAGVDHGKTNKAGWVRLYVPDKAYYAVVVSYDQHKEVLYEEVLTPGFKYEYMPGPVVTPEQHYKAGVRAMALVVQS